MTCDVCGAPLQISDFPFCPHGRYAGNAVEDSIPGGMVVENMSHEPFTVYSQTEFKAAMREHKVELRDRWAGPGDRYLSNWASVSAKSLDDAKALLERVGQASGTTRATVDAAFTVGPWRES